jgi:hypothetical protein
VVYPVILFTPPYYYFYNTLGTKVHILYKKTKKGDVNIFTWVELSESIERGNYDETKVA